MKHKLVLNLSLLMILSIGKLLVFSSSSKANQFFLGCWRWTDGNQTIRYNFESDYTYTHKTNSTKKNGEPFSFGSSGNWRYDGVSLIISDDKNGSKGFFRVSSPNTLSISFGYDNYTYRRC